MGLGLLGRGVGDALWLARHGAELLVTDKKSEQELVDSLMLLSGHNTITFRLGGHDDADFQGNDLILKAAGVPLDSPYIKTAREHNVPVDMSASLFARIAPTPLIGVTGTRGKSTVTHLIHTMLEAAGHTSLLGGNVKGVSNLALLDEADSAEYGVFELDSWQCQGFGEEYSLDAPQVRQRPLSPHVAVFTTFMDDHLNYYMGDREAYLKDKANIFLHQSENDILVVGRQAETALTAYKQSMRARVIIADESDVPDNWSPRLIGRHNRYNIGLAVRVARELGVDEEFIRNTVESFAALPGRLEKVAEWEGVPVFNDTNATTPDATLTSIEALEHDYHVVLIAGGTDKGLDVTKLNEKLATMAHAILLPGTGTDKLEVLHATLVATLEEAVDEARRQAAQGSAVLFSPAFASFGLFKNEYNRGEQFTQLAHNE